MLPSLWRPTSSHTAMSSLVASNACGARKSNSSPTPTSFQTMRSSLSASRRFHCTEVFFGGDPRVFGRYNFTVDAKRFRGGSVIPSIVSVARRSFDFNVVPSRGTARIHDTSFQNTIEAGHRFLQGRVWPCRVVRRHDHFTAGVRQFRYAECCLARWPVIRCSPTLGFHVARVVMRRGLPARVSPSTSQCQHCSEETSGHEGRCRCAPCYPSLPGPGRGVSFIACSTQNFVHSMIRLQR